MHVYQDKSLSLYFGDAADDVRLDRAASLSSKAVCIEQKGKTACKALGCSHVFFAHQVHGAVGIVFEKDGMSSFAASADFVCTNQTAYGIGVLTADCLPIVIYDPIHQAVSVVHAGWRGTVQHIAVHAIKKMHSQYHSCPSDMQIFFGPCAGTCCYAVGTQVLEAVCPQAKRSCIIEKNGTSFFDLIGYNRWALMQEGILPDQCSEQFHCCTICNPAYFSYRRHGFLAGVNMTIACLHSTH